MIYIYIYIYIYRERERERERESKLREVKRNCSSLLQVVNWNTSVKSDENTSP